MLFYSFFKTLVGNQVTVELKNDIIIKGTLHSVDQFLNIRLTDVSAVEASQHPYIRSVKNCFIRGSVVRYVELPSSEVDAELLQEASLREAMQQHHQQHQQPPQAPQTST